MPMRAEFLEEPELEFGAGTHVDIRYGLSAFGPLDRGTMTAPREIRVGLVGSQFVSSIHAEALRADPHADIRAVASPSPGHAQAFAERFSIPQHLTDYKKMLAMPEIDMVVVGVPNDLHCPIALDAAAAGKHVVMEKPLCLNLAEADRMIAACRDAGVKLMYAEELCFAPKYVRLKQLLDSGALGKPTLLKQSEKHDGPHAPHFWDVERAGGGVTMDMGCHAIEFFRWMLGRPKICAPVFIRIWPGAWLKASVTIDLTMAISSTTVARCGSSSDNSAPHWPCLANLNFGPSSLEFGLMNAAR